MQFKHIDLKTGLELPLPPKIAEHTYLELKIGNAVDPSKLAVGKMYSGISARDIQQLQDQGLHIILANNASTAYFANREIAEKVSKEIFPNHSDAVAYGSLPVSEAKASVYKETARILIIDDETLKKDPVTGIYATDWGQQPIALSNGITLSDKAMGAIASKLGDCYNLISSELANQLQAEPDRPFQFRAGVPEWQGMMKGTCRSSLLCQALEVDAIIAKSSIKGDGKNTTTGIHDVGLFWSRKEDAKFTEQKLGTQALVFFPEGVKADILPKLKEKAEALAAAQSDPRQLAQLYIEQHERQQERRRQDTSNTISQLIEPELATELGLTIEQCTKPNTLEVPNIPPAKEEYKDWLYDILKADLVNGGHYQVLEMQDIVSGLQKFVQSQWQDIATGGMYVPSAIAQPSNQLQQGEVSFRGLPDGARVAIYRSPVANTANFDVFTNNLTNLRESDPEAYRQRGVIYMNPDDAKRLVIDFDGDRVAIIPDQLTPQQQANCHRAIEQYPQLIAEIIDKNLPHNKPVQVQKEKKIPRDSDHGFMNLASAAVDASNNPTGKIANLGMRLEALRWETQYLPVAEKSAYLQNIGSHFQKLLAEDRDIKKPFRIISNDFRDKITEISEISNQICKLPEAERQKAVETGLAKTERLLWNLEALAAVNLQRAVDTPKSARKVDEDEYRFCQKVAKYKQVEWIQDKDSTSAYIGNEGIRANTQDPVGWMVQQANQIYQEYSLIGDLNYNRFDHIFPKDTHTPIQTEWAKTVVSYYNSQIAEASLISDRLQQEEGIALTATSAKGNKIGIVNLISTDPTGESPIWQIAKTGGSVDIEIDKNKDWKTEKQYPYKAIAITNEGRKVDVGLISPTTIKEHGDLLYIGRKFSNLKLDFVLGISKDDLKKKLEAAEAYLENQADSIPDSQRQSMAAALWHHNSRKIATKMFADIVTTRLQDLQVVSIKAIGLQYDTNQFKDRKFQQQESVSCRLTVESDLKSPIYNNRVLQLKDGELWKNMGSLAKDAAYIPIGTQFAAKINLAANRSSADLFIDPNSLKFPEVWHGLSSERVKEAVNLEAIMPALKQAIAKAAESRPTMTEFLHRLAQEKVGVKMQVQSGHKIHGITYFYQGQPIKASLIDSQFKNLTAMGVQYNPQTDREAIISASNLNSDRIIQSLANTEIQALGNIEQPLQIAIQNLESWKQIAKYLGKSDSYLNRIQEIIEGDRISEKAQKAMAGDHHSLSQHIGSQWRQILSMPSDYLELQNNTLVFERKGNQGNYKATLDRSTDTLTLFGKIVNQGDVKYLPLLVQQGAEIKQSQIALKDVQNVDRALNIISNQNTRQDQNHIP